MKEKVLSILLALYAVLTILPVSALALTPEGIEGPMLETTTAENLNVKQNSTGRITLADSSTSIKVGEYIILGKYYGEPILWRCVAIDENGPLMLSDKILCLKAYDAKGNSEYHYVSGAFSSIRKQYGSNCYADSNIRQWLNSTDTHITWTHDEPSNQNVSGGNSYNTESGFLSPSNFNDNERNCMKSITRKVYTNMAENTRGVTDGGSREHDSVNGLMSAQNRNYTNCYYMFVTDTVFIPDLDQLVTAYYNLGNEYIKAYPTKSVELNSDYSSGQLNSKTPYKYWIAHAGTNGYSYEWVNAIAEDGTCTGFRAWDGTVGVRPAFYLNESVWDNGGGSDPSSAPTSVYSNLPDALTLVISENTKAPGNPKDKYQCSSGANITCGSAVSQTGKSGAYKIDNFKNMTSLMVGKSGFASVTRTREQLRDYSQVFLEPVKEGYPTVTAVWLDGVDIRHAEKGINLLGSKSVTITADVAWDSAKGSGTIKLIQGAKSIAFSGNTVTTVLKDNFDVSKTIYIWAGYDSTYETMKPLKLKPATAVPDKLDGFGLNLGDGMNFTLPDSVPLLGGTKMGVGLISNSPIPVTIEVEDGKIYAAIGYQNDGEYGKHTGWTAKSFAGAVKNCRDTFKSAGSAVDQYKSIRSAMKAFDSKLARGKGSFGVDADFSIMGFAEGYLDESGTPHWLDTGMIIGISGGVGYSFPFYIGPVPLFFETSLSAEASAQLNLLVQEAAKSFTPTGVVEGSITLSGGLGVGIKKVASLSGGLEGELADHWEIILDDTDYNRLTAKLKAYAKVGVLFFSGTKKWDLAEKTWEWPDRASLQSLEMEPYASLYDPSQYALMSEAEMTDNSVFLANDTVSLFSAENGGMQENIFAANVYSQAKPQLAAFSDGTLLAVWTGLDNRRATYDRPRLYYALCENGIWSNPAPVDTISSTMESEPSLTIANDTAYLTWCRANAPMETPADLTEAAAKLDIFAGVFDRTNNQWTVSRLTSDQTADFSPMISGGNSGVAIVWLSNTANDVFGQSGTTSVSGSQYASGAWGPLLSQYNNVGEISNLAVDMSGSVPRIAWTQAEADGAFAVYLDGVRQSSGSDATFHNGCLYWYQDGHLYQDGQDVGVTLESDRFQIENNTLLYTSGSGLYSTLMAHYYDVSSGRWSDAVALTDGRQSIGSFSAASVGTTVQVLMSSTEVTKEMADIQSDSDDPYGSTNLVLLKDAPVCDLSIGEPWYLEDTYAPGSTMGFRLEVTNNGTVSTNYVVSVSSADETTNTVISQQRLLPGCTEEVTVAYEQGETLSSQLTFTVKALDGSDANSTNDQTTLTLQYEDVAVEHIGNGVTEDGQYLVYADIVNRGYGVQSGITVGLYQDAVSDSPLQTVVVDSLNSMCSQPVSFQVPAPADQSCYVIAVSHGGTDMNAATDSDFTVCTLQESVPIELISVAGNQVEFWLDGVPAGTLVVAAYDGNRKMDTVGVTRLSGGETEVCVIMQSAVPEGDSLTAYVLDAETQTPLIKNVNLA